MAKRYIGVLADKRFLREARRMPLIQGPFFLEPPPPDEDNDEEFPPAFIDTEHDAPGDEDE